MKLSPQGRAKLKAYEGFRAEAYIPVPGDVPTIGYGFTAGVTMGMTMTRAQADARLTTELGPYERAVEQACTRKPNQNQLDAMVSLCWNIGIAGFRRSTVLRRTTGATIRQRLGLSACGTNRVAWSMPG